MSAFLSKVLMVLGMAVMIGTDLIITVQDFLAGNLMGGFTEMGILAGLIGGAFHLHFAFDFLGIKVDTDAPVDTPAQPKGP